MPIVTDNAWPAGLLTIFEHGRAKHDLFENRYYGPYNTLLQYCFGIDFKFYIAPQIPQVRDSRDTGDFIVFFVVFDANDKPVLLLEVKPDTWSQSAELRYRADNQMRERFDLMLNEAPTPRLWGISALGTSTRIYCGNKATGDVEPEVVPRPKPSARVLPSSFLEGEWNLDILSQEGFDRMKEIVTDILHMHPHLLKMQLNDLLSAKRRGEDGELLRAPSLAV